MKEFLSILSTLPACNKNELDSLHKHLLMFVLEQIISKTDFWLLPYLFDFTLLTENDVRRVLMKVRWKNVVISLSRSSHPRHSIKKLFLKIPQYSQESTCVRVSFLIKLHSTLKRRLQRGCFSANITKSLRAPFLKNLSEQLLLIDRTCSLTRKRES